MHARKILWPALICIVVAGILFGLKTNDLGLGVPIPNSQAPIPVAPGGILSRLSLIPSAWKTRSLVGVMIENHEDARPYHQGLEDALLIVEFPVEGFITRFNVLFDRGDLPKLMGPVRSLRPYFLDAMLPWAPPQLYAGGSPEAFDRIATIGTVFAVNGLAHPKSFLRDDGVPAPHNLFVDDAGVETLIEEASPKKVRWPPYEVGSVQSGCGALSIFVNLLNPQNDIRYSYDYFSQTYLRQNGASESKARPSNILLLEIPVTNIGEHGRLTIPLKGGGDALLFRNGTVERGHWKKTGDTQWFTFVNEEGETMQFARGLTWITVQPSLHRVRWKNSL